jgi:two-component system, cell cycle response regulator
VVLKNLTVAKMRRENERLQRELEAALRNVSEKNAQLEESLKRVEEMAATDPLTGLYNRRYFSRVLEQQFAEAQRYDQDLACVMIDLDRYKQLNDTLGHQVGDELLVLAGKVIAANLRRMDVAARYGGDEFILLLPKAGADDASIAAERIRQEFRLSSSLLLAREHGVSMSVGIGSIRTNAPLGAEQLVASADAALYLAKEAGRDRVSLFQRQAPVPVMHA